jgi:hypothetical protein
MVYWPMPMVFIFVCRFMGVQSYGEVERHQEGKEEDAAEIAQGKETGQTGKEERLITAFVPGIQVRNPGFVGAGPPRPENRHGGLL